MASTAQLSDWEQRVEALGDEGVLRLETATIAVYGELFLKRLKSKYEGDPQLYAVALIRLADRLAGREDW